MAGSIDRCTTLNGETLRVGDKVRDTNDPSNTEMTITSIYPVAEGIETVCETYNPVTGKVTEEEYDINDLRKVL